MHTLNKKTEDDDETETELLLSNRHVASSSHTCSGFATFFTPYFTAYSFCSSSSSFLLFLSFAPFFTPHFTASSILTAHHHIPVISGSFSLSQTTREPPFVPLPVSLVINNKLQQLLAAVVVVVLTSHTTSSLKAIVCVSTTRSCCC